MNIKILDLMAYALMESERSGFVPDTTDVLIGLLDNFADQVLNIFLLLF